MSVRERKVDLSLLSTKELEEIVKNEKLPEAARENAAMLQMLLEDSENGEPVEGANLSAEWTISIPERSEHSLLTRPRKEIQDRV